MKKLAVCVAGCLAATCVAMPAHSATIVLDFEGVGDLNSVGNFYNGGAGTNYGISFSNARAIVDSDAGGSGNIANEPSASTTIDFTSGTAATMNVAAGFDTGFSFFYSSSTAAGFVTVYDGLNGTGNVLAMLNLAQQANTGCVGDPNGFYCNWTPIGVTFLGTARSVDFGGSANFITFDNITLGSEVAGGVPEPAIWAFMIVGFGAIGASLRAARRKEVSLAAA